MDWIDAVERCDEMEKNNKLKKAKQKTRRTSFRDLVMTGANGVLYVMTATLPSAPLQFPPLADGPPSSSKSRPPAPLPLAAPPTLSKRTANHPTPPSHHPTLTRHFHNRLCMGDPASDHGFLYDEQGRVDILNSPFFDVSFGNDRTADEYVDRVIYQLTLALEDRLPQGPWYIVSNPPTSPNPTSSPATYTLRVTCLLVALLSALAIFSR
ncbi:hypothetical protein M5K25_024394 [Dendrobium thyrsiflorum]|uniref:Uncharacterized protein n=1 Tax=Dendrobium thyrsiflorum TaxID=117978 RepID=A0ABD0U228_DENTH